MTKNIRLLAQYCDTTTNEVLDEAIIEDETVVEADKALERFDELKAVIADKAVITKLSSFILTLKIPRIGL